MRKIVSTGKDIRSSAGSGGDARITSYTLPHSHDSIRYVANYWLIAADRIVRTLALTSRATGRVPLFEMAARVRDKAMIV